MNCIIGYFPNKIGLIMFYCLDVNSYNLYISITNGLIWFSHGNIFFINLFYNDEFYDTFLNLIPGKRKRAELSTLVTSIQK